MIKLWYDVATQEVATKGINTYPELDIELALDLLAIIAATQSLRDLTPLKCAGLYKPRKKQPGLWVLSICARWGICFHFKEGDAYDVEIFEHKNNI